MPGRGPDPGRPGLSWASAQQLWSQQKPVVQHQAPAGSFTCCQSSSTVTSSSSSYQPRLACSRLHLLLVQPCGRGAADRLGCCTRCGTRLPALEQAGQSLQLTVLKRGAAFLA